MDDYPTPLDVCRTCGAEEGEIGIFDEQGLELKLAERINAYLPITVSADDELSLALCRVCSERLESWHELVSSCIDTDERLRQLRLYQSEEDSKNIKDLEYAENCSSDLLIFTEETCKAESESARQFITRHLNIQKSGLVAPNVYVIPSLYSKSVHEENGSQNMLKNLSNGFFCDGCNAWYKQQDKFITHQLHCPLIKTFECALCEYKADDRVDLVRHTDTHKSFQEKILNDSLQNMCSICKRVLSTKMALKLHMRTHSGEKPYDCQYCDKAFAQKNALKYHEKTHTDVKPYYCRFCQKGFNGKMVLQTHERVHTGERPYKCVTCGATFRSSANLYQHQIVHNDDKPFKCPLCHKRFGRPEKVKIHLRTHTGEKPYSCPICARRFAQKGDMMKHTLIHIRQGRYGIDLTNEENILLSELKVIFE